MPTGRPPSREKADDDILRPMFVNFQELVVVDDMADDFLHVVGPVRVVGNEGVQFERFTQRVIGGGASGGSCMLLLGG